MVDSLERSSGSSKDNKQNIPIIRFNYNDSWSNKKIKELADVIGGGTPSTNIEEYWGGTINWFTPTEVGQSKYVSESERKITKEGLDKSSAKILPKNTILLTTRATIGRVSITNTEATTNQGFQSIICKNVDLNFMYYLIQTLEKTLIRKSVGSTFLEISKREIENIKVKLPSLEEQRKIGEFLSLIDERIELMEKKYQIITNLKQTLIKQLYPNNNELIPILRFKIFNEKWNIIKIGKIGKVTTGTTPKTKEKENYEKNGILWITPGDIDNNKYILDTERKLSLEGYKKGRSIKKNSIFVTCIGIIGKKCINLNDCSCNQQINAITPFVDFDTSFIYYAIDKYMHNLDVLAGQSVTPIINKKDFSKIEIMAPSLNEQKIISNFLSSFDKKIEILKKQIEVYKEFKRSLLSKMFC